MAQNDFIKLDRSNTGATEAAELLATVRDLRTVYERLSRIRAKMRHNFDDSSGGNTINWAAMESLWGIPAGNTSVGPTANGARVFTFVDGATGSMEGVFQTSAARDITETLD